MKIPKTTSKPRFYVATSMTEAHSSWSTVQDAVRSWGHFRNEAKGNPDRYGADYDAIIGIVRVDRQGRKLIRDKVHYGPPDPDPDLAGTTPASPPSRGGLSKTVHFTTDSVHPYCDRTRAMGENEPSSVSWGDVTCRGCLQCKQPRDPLSRPLNLATLRAKADDRSSSSQRAALDACGDVNRLCDALELAWHERDQARQEADRLRTAAREVIAAWGKSVTDPVAMQRAIDRLEALKP